MKPKTENKLMKGARIFAIIIMGFTFLFLIYITYDRYSTGAFSLESAMKKIVKEGEELSHSQVINENEGVGFINYDCTPINRITKGVKDCKGQYYIFAYRINRTWVVGEETKHIIW